MTLTNSLARAAALIAACGTLNSFALADDYRLRSDGIDFGAGEAPAANIAIQTINPFPRNSWNTRIDVNGQRLLVGIKRYQANQSLEPQGLSTQNINTTNNNGSGSGGAGGSPAGN